MTTIVITAVAILLAIFVAIKMGKKKVVEPSIDLAETLLPKTDIHLEIAKRAEEIKAQTKIESKPKTKKKEAPKKSAPKKKAQPKKKG